MVFFEEILLDRSKTIVILWCVLQSGIYLCDFCDMLNIHVMYFVSAVCTGVHSKTLLPPLLYKNRMNLNLIFHVREKDPQFRMKKGKKSEVVYCVGLTTQLSYIFITVNDDVFVLGASKVAQQAASYGKIRESKEAAWDEEIWQKGTSKAFFVVLN